MKTYRDMNHFIQTHIILLSWDNVQALGYWWVLSAHSELLRWLHILRLLRLLPADTPPLIMGEGFATWVRQQIISSPKTDDTYFPT